MDSDTILTFREKLWGTLSGRRLPIKDLDVHHLVNVLNWIIARPDVYPRTTLINMIAEANYRKMVLFLERDVIPIETEPGVWKVMDLTSGVISDAKGPEERNDTC